MSVCDLCKNTGLIPFKKDGKVIPHALLDCVCRVERLDEEHYQSRLPEDFDFACSDTWRGFYCGELYAEPKSIKELELADITDELLFHIDETLKVLIPQRYLEQIQQLKGQVLHLQGKIEEHIRRKKSAPRKAGESEGIEI